MTAGSSSTPSASYQQGKVVSVNTSVGGIPKLPQKQVKTQTTHLEGDGRNHAKHDRPWRAVSLLSTEALVSGHFHKYGLKPGEMGENLSIEGLEVQNLDPGALLHFSGGVIIEITEPRTPCYVLDALSPTIQEEAWEHCGVMGRIIQDGVLSPGETVTVGENRWQKNDLHKWQGTAVILAGGTSSRMGFPKDQARLPNGKTFLEQLVDLLTPVVERVVVSVRSPEQSLPPLPPQISIVSDETSGQGPLGGVLSVLDASDGEEFVFLTCDMPALSPYLLRLLLHSRESGSRIFRSEASRRIMPFPFVLQRKNREDLRTFLKEGNRTVREFLHRLGLSKITLPSRFDRCFVNLNTPEELREHNTLSNEVPSSQK
jgi:molybdopterin-guanine dinucleotide biosynthesis protein A